jgi:hypothetical protein
MNNHNPFKMALETEFENDKQLQQEEQQKENPIKELGKDISVDVVVDEALGMANIAIPIEGLDILLKIFKAIDMQINYENYNTKGRTR